MYQLVLVLHIVFSVLLIVLILFQKGKGAAMGGSFGGGASQTVFGSKKPIGLLMKITIAIATFFFGTCIVLTCCFIKTENVLMKENFFNNSKNVSAFSDNDDVAKESSYANDNQYEDEFMLPEEF